MRALSVLGLLGVICGLLVGCRSEKKPEAAPPAPPSAVDAGTAVTEPVVEDDTKMFFVVKQTPISLQPAPGSDTSGRPLPILSQIRLRVPPDGGEWAELPDGGGFVELAALAETRPSGARAEELAIEALSHGAISGARALAALSDAGDLKAALAMEQLPPESVVVAPMRDGGTDGGTPEIGQVRFVAAVGSGLRTKPELNAELSTPLYVNDAVRVVELSDDWARVRMRDAAAAPTEVADSGTQTEAGSGWIPLAHLVESPLWPDSLLELASEDPSAAQAALHVAAALTDDPTLWSKLVTTAVKLGQYTEAMRGAYELAANEALPDLVLNYVYGCRGNHLTATFVDEKKAETGDLPKDACVYNLSAPPCPPCQGPLSNADYLKNLRSAEETRRTRIRKRFPRGPAVQAMLPGGLVSSRRLFLYAVPFTFEYSQCNQYEADVRVQRMVFSKPIALAPAPRAEWLFSNAPEHFHGEHVLFGALLARNEEHARKQISVWNFEKWLGDPNELVRSPNTFVNMDLCSECVACD